MRCDLHVHTLHSGMCTVPLLSRICRESYTDPVELYQRLKRQGMDLVTVTDHDSMGAAEVLSRYPEFFASEEVTCRMPSGAEIHMGVYDIREQDHDEIQKRRDDIPALVAYLRERDLFFSINHVFSGLTGRRALEDFELFRRDFPGLETLNGAMLGLANRRAATLARIWDKAAVGGSDAHTLRAAGKAFTEIGGARNKQEFLAGLREGRGVVYGSSGTFAKLTLDVLSIGAGLFRERPEWLLLAPAALAVPAITAVNWALESIFAEKWARKVGARPGVPVTAEPGWEVQ